MSEAEQLQDRVAKLEDITEQLEQKYKDVAYEFTDNLAKRIEGIRDEIYSALAKVTEHVESEGILRVRKVAEEGMRKVTEAVEETRKHAAEAITKDVVEALTDGSHTLVVRPASRAEQQTAIPVRQAGR